MATEQYTTWICDRCGWRVSELAQGAPVLPERWLRLHSMDLCAACLRSYNDWLRAPPTPKEGG